MVVVGDFVIIRFATKSYSFMRMGHNSLGPWLRARKIVCTVKGPHLYFELPEEFTRYTVVTQKLCDELRPLGRQVKAALHMLSYMTARKYRDPLSPEEIRLLIENDIPIQL